MKTIDRQISETRDDVHYTEVLDIDGSRFKVAIRSNSYAFQSHAKIVRWNGEEWKNVYSLHHTEMKTPHGLCYARENKTSPTQFTDDRNQLIKVAKAIV